MDSCLFCKIICGEVPSKKVYEDESVYAFYDINPQAPVHVLLIPKKHIDRIENLQEEDAVWMGRLMVAARKVGELLGLKNGYRLVFNNGGDGGQEVDHIHLHLLGGIAMGWPPYQSSSSSSSRIGQ